MKKLLRFSIVTLFLLLSITSVFAQDEDSETLPLGGAFTVTVPDSWEITTPTGSGYFWETDDSIVRIRTYSPFTQESFGVDDGDVEGMMEFLVTDAYETPDYDDDEIEAMTFGDYEGIRYTYEESSAGETYLRTIMLYVIENDFIIAGNIVHIEEFEPIAEDVSALETALATVEMQDIYVFHEGSQLALPEGWQIRDDQNVDFSVLRLSNGSINFELGLWPSYGAIVGLENPADFLAYFFFDNGIFSEITSFRRDNLEETTAAGFDAVWYPVTSDRVNADGMYERGVLAFITSNNSGFTVRITSETPDESLDEVFEIIDTLETGSELVCIIFTAPGTRIRSEPSTSADLVRETDNESFVGTFQATDDAGNTWYNIGEGWVRFDVVDDFNTCDNLPVGR